MRQMTIGKLLELYNTGERDFRGIKFIEPEIRDFRDFRGLNLSGIDLRYSDLDPFVFFTEIDLSKADLRGLDLSRRNIERANLSGANLSGASLLMTDFWESDLIDTNFIYARDIGKLIDCRFKNTIMPDGSIKNS